jgi:hypothetical protein
MKKHLNARIVGLQAPAGKFNRWLLSQDLVWIDADGNCHAIHLLHPEYALNILLYLAKRGEATDGTDLTEALRKRALAAVDFDVDTTKDPEEIVAEARRYSFQAVTPRQSIQQTLQDAITLKRRVRITTRPNRLDTIVTVEGLTASSLSYRSYGRYAQVKRIALIRIDTATLV